LARAVPLTHYLMKTGFLPVGESPFGS